MGFWGGNAGTHEPECGVEPFFGLGVSFWCLCLQTKQKEIKKTVKGRARQAGKEKQANQDILSKAERNARPEQKHTDGAMMGRDESREAGILANRRRAQRGEFEKWIQNATRREHLVYGPSQSEDAAAFLLGWNLSNRGRKERQFPELTTRPKAGRERRGGGPDGMQPWPAWEGAKSVALSVGSTRSCECWFNAGWDEAVDWFGQGAGKTTWTPSRGWAGRLARTGHCDLRQINKAQSDQGRRGVSGFRIQDAGRRDGWMANAGTKERAR